MNKYRPDPRTGPAAMILGSNFRERGETKRLIERWVARFKAMPFYRQAALYAALSQVRWQRQPFAAATDADNASDLQVKRWLASYPRREDVTYVDSGGTLDETGAARQARLFKAAIYDLSLLVDEYGYEAVYFGVGCVAFPDAVDPWGDGQY